MNGQNKINKQESNIDLECETVLGNELNFNKDSKHEENYDMETVKSLKV